MTGWQALPEAVREAVESACGAAVTSVEPAAAGCTSEFAATLHTDSSRVFCKAVTTTNPLAWMCRNEARVVPALDGVAPRLEWMVETGGWLVLGFEHQPGRHADLRPGSPDLPRLAELLTSQEQRLTPAPVPVLGLAERWAKLPAWRTLRNDPPSDLDPWVRQNLPLLTELEADAPSLVDGPTLVHTDFTGENLLVTDHRIWVVDWAWPAHAAAWANVAFTAYRMIDAGHRPPDAEAWAAQIPTWRATTGPALTAFTVALYGIRHHRAQSGDRPHYRRLAEAAGRWVRHRLAS